MNLIRMINHAWTWQCGPAARRFRRAAAQVADAQAAVLREILRQAAETDYGRAFQLASVRGPREFQDRLPLADYEDLSPWIQQAANGSPNGLTRQAARLYQPTSGSCGPEKLIPYTPLLQIQFQRAIQAWIHDLYTQTPAVRRGRSYWAITPHTLPPRTTASGVRIGFADDVEYLNPWMRRLAARQLAVPSGVARLRDPEQFRLATLSLLLACRDLSLISVWSPTYLTALLHDGDAHLDSLCRDIFHGRVYRGAGDGDEIVLRPDRRRARQLADVWARFDEAAERWRAVWPHLALISCWADAASGPYLKDLEKHFPDTPLQPKGLLATEGVVSIPVVGQTGAALAVTSHFLEFLPCDAAGRLPASDPRPRLAHQLEEQACYEVVLTTGGGLYRYRLGDVVQVVGFLGQCPRVRFLGRGGGVSDLVGEKLAESHVRLVLETTMAALCLQPRFALLAPQRSGPAAYRLLLECEGLGEAVRGAIASQVEQGLRQNPHYRHAAASGQLGPVEVIEIQGPRGMGWRTYQRHYESTGRRIGDIKPVALDRNADWVRLFQFAGQGSPREPSVL